MSKLAGSNACVCASAQMKRGGVLSRAARACASAIIGSEMSMPTRGAVRAEQPRDGERRAARAAADVEHALRPSRDDGLDEQVLERLEQPVEQLLRFDPGASGAAVPKGDLLVRWLAVVSCHDCSPRLLARTVEALCHFKST